jgi:hypothetical protein
MTLNPNKIIQDSVMQHKLWDAGSSRASQLKAQTSMRALGVDEFEFLCGLAPVFVHRVLNTATCQATVPFSVKKRISKWICIAIFLLLMCSLFIAGSRADAAIFMEGLSS